MESSPRELEPYDRAYVLRRKYQDEADWMLGQYVMSAFGTVLSQAFSKNSKAEYVKHPRLQNVSESKEEQESEVLEMKAFAEMQKFAVIMRQQGLPETEMIDI